MSVPSVENTVYKAADGNEIEYKTAEDHGTLDKDDFMKLFVTQLQYQDPMQPMQSAEMASQVAQFNMVDLMYKNNDAMKEMVDAENSRTSMSAVSMIGHKVRYEGNILPVTGDGPENFSIDLDKPASECNVVIKNSDGQVVASWDAGFMPAGKNPLGWDGKDMNGDPVPEGEYTVSVQAMDDKGEDVSVVTWTTGLVDGITYQDDGLPELTMADGTAVNLSKVWMVEG